MLLKLVTVYLLSAPSTGAGPATADAKRVRIDQPATLVVALRAEVDGTSHLFSDTARKVDLGDGKGPRAAEPWPTSEPLAVRWFKVEPTAPYVDNEAGGFHWAEIPYAETAWATTAGAATLSRPADVRATVLGDRGGLGTMAFKVEVTAGGKTVATPGMESRHRGGISAKVHRITVRADDTFLGYLTELYNTPYIWASAGDAGVHQADRNIGSDCADLMVYGLRRTGRRIEYGSTYDVPRWGGRKPVASAASRAEDGRFLDAAGNPIPTKGPGAVLPGDLVLFHRHVGAFARDEAPLGVLDANDLLLHTAWAPPAQESFEVSARWTSAPFTVWRIP